MFRCISCKTSDDMPACGVLDDCASSIIVIIIIYFYVKVMFTHSYSEDGVLASAG